MQPRLHFSCSIKAAHFGDRRGDYSTFDDSSGVEAYFSASDSGCYPFSEFADVGSRELDEADYRTRIIFGLRHG